MQSVQEAQNNAELITGRSVKRENDFFNSILQLLTKFLKEFFELNLLNFKKSFMGSLKKNWQSSIS